MSQNGSARPIVVTVTDPETGETATREVWNDFLVICAGDKYLAHIARHSNGTSTVTVKQGEPR